MSRYLWILAMAARLSGAEPQPSAPYTPAHRVEIAVYSDFQCPFCAQFVQPLRQLMAKGVEGVELTVEFMHFPLSFHPDAQLAHQAALAAREQGKFWEMHDLLFSNQGALKRDNLFGYAKRLGLDLGRFQKDLESEEMKKAIARDKENGEKQGVTGTPSFFLNGNAYTGTKSFEELTRLVQEERRRMRAVSEIPYSLMSKGPANAPVTLEFFADLESPVSQPAVSVLDDALERYPSAVRLQFRNFPLAFHPQAPLAHAAAMIAAQQGRFWDFAAYILAHQESLREQDLIAYAGRLGLDQARFAETIQERRYTPRVDADVTEGFKRGIRGSPVVFVNGKRIDGVPSLKTLTEYIEAELAAKKQM